MPEFKLPYGKTHLKFSLPDDRTVELVAPVKIAADPDPLARVGEALDALIGLPQAGLAEFTGVTSAAIAINDKTRPVPHQFLLPPLLNRLEQLGLPPQAVTLIVASGTHIPMPAAEYPQILPPEIIARYPVISHNANDPDALVFLGVTQRHTPVWANRCLVEADLKIVVGNIEPHQFMGFSGGVKSAAIGLTGAETINRNHAMLTHPQAQLGRYADNPMRQDVEEIGRMMGVQLALNTILNDSKEIVKVIAGEPKAVMEAGIPMVRQLYQTPVVAPFDLLIVSPGGYPKDINLYQAQKALGHATLIAKTGGTVILAAACSEGTGSRAYEEWIAGKKSHREVLDAFKTEEFRLGKHKAFQISRDASRLNVVLVSEMPADFVRRLLLNPADSLDAALAQALEQLPPEARIGLMPWANATIPDLPAPTVL